MTSSSKYNFSWKDLGDISLGRPKLGPTTHVAVYRLMQYTMRDILGKRLGEEQANQIFIDAGFKAGVEFCTNVLDRSLGFNEFIANLADNLLTLGIGILRVEKADMEKMSFVITVSEDLDCSGLPFSGVAFCDYDEGFISGIMHAYTQKNFHVREVDCWGTGERTCRFSVEMI
jgi:predicted hydrocarbon binding protein